MKMGYDLSLEQQQKLIMTPELKMALKILQLNTVELDALIDYEIQTNPVLEVAEDFKEEQTERKTKEDNKVEAEGKDKDIDWREYLQYQGKSYCMEHGYRSDENNEFPFENLGSSATTLVDHLLFQLQLTELKGKERNIAEYIIESIDKNGYLTQNVQFIARTFKKKIEEIEKILSIIQTFEPYGVGARGLKECLLIQVKYITDMDPNITVIIENHLDDIANNRIHVIAKKVGISSEAAQDLTDIIKTLEPKPGRAFASGDSTKYITPDAYVEKIDNEYVIIINDQYSSKLVINQYYKNILNSEQKDTQAIQYINDRLSAASWLLRSIEHRKNTLYLVIEAIINHQREFFDNGVMHLKPLTLKKIANEIEVHESTVSRTINGKYAQTPRGVFELKYFFKSGVDNNLGNAISSESIKNKIKLIIDAENHSKPLSDQDIVEILQKENMSISRRTVAKYRDELGILSSSKRKRY